jgi:hypothetical protein
MGYCAVKINFENEAIGQGQQKSVILLWEKK